FWCFSGQPHLLGRADCGDPVGRAGQRLAIRAVTDRNLLGIDIGLIGDAATMALPVDLHRVLLSKNKRRPKGAVLSIPGKQDDQCAVRPPEASSEASGLTGTLVSSSQTIGTGARTSAREITSSRRATGMISMPPLIASDISVRSLALSSGISTVLMPPRAAASSFSFKPPIGRTRPRSVISPVMATSCRIGIPVMVETIAVAIATPADGPSFGVAPSGTWTWISRLSNSGGSRPEPTARERTKDAAAEIDSFITSRRLPVTVILPLPGIMTPSIV